jgi:hypothetical protein
VSPNPAHGEVYAIQHYVINIVSDLWQVCPFLWLHRFLTPIKLTTTIFNWHIVESGFKHQISNPNPLFFLHELCIFSSYIKLCVNWTNTQNRVKKTISTKNCKQTSYIPLRLCVFNRLYKYTSYLKLYFLFVSYIRLMCILTSYTQTEW